MALDVATRPTPTRIHAATDLTPGERRHLTALERRIEHGLQTFKEVGTALMEVRDSRLYRDVHPSFEAYCQTRWGLERQRAYQLIGAVEVVAALPEAGRGLIRNEATARELVPLMRDDPAAFQAVWARVTEVAKDGDGKVTAETVRQVKAEVLPPREDVGPNLMARIIAEAGRLHAAYISWMETDPKPKDKRAVNATIRAIIAPT